MLFELLKRTERSERFPFAPNLFHGDPPHHHLTSSINTYYIPIYTIMHPVKASFFVYYAIICDIRNTSINCPSDFSQKTGSLAVFTGIVMITRLLSAVTAALLLRKLPCAFASGGKACPSGMSFPRSAFPGRPEEWSHSPIPIPFLDHWPTKRHTLLPG